MTSTDPLVRLRDLMRDYPDLPRLVERLWAGRGTPGLPDWPRWCFLPMAGWYAMAQPHGRIAFDRVGEVGRLAAIGTWRYSLGIYRFDADLQAALALSEVAGDLPAEVFYRLPEWCLYLETPGLTWGRDELAGFWVHLEHDVESGRPELRLLLNLADRLAPIPIHLGPWTVVEALERMIAESRRQASLIGHLLPAESPAPQMAELLPPLLSMVLYLCSEAPEVDNLRKPGEAPYRAAPIQTKRGLRLLPPNQPTIWRVGARMGEQLRADRRARGEPGEQSGRRVHLRRGHWHGYWTGPRTGEQRFIYHWLPPMIVGGNDEGEPA